MPQARDRAGGRALNLQLPNGGVTEGGAEFIGPTQDHLKALAGSPGVATFTTYPHKDGMRTPYPTDGLLSSVPPAAPARLANATNVHS